LPVVAAAVQPKVIRIAVADRNDCGLAGHAEEAYRMRNVGERIELIGNCPRATLYAVYDFLERHLGCGGCMPGDDTVPRRATIRLKALDHTIAGPAFSTRQIVLYPYNPALLKKNNLPHTDWLTKNRMNWAHPGPNIWERMKSRQTFVPEVEKRGLLLGVGGHTFNTGLPHDRYAAAHPEYFAMLADGNPSMSPTGHRSEE
jgi:hypothetical protein